MVVLGILAKQFSHSIRYAPSSKQWWEAMQAGSFGEDWWKENLHLSHKTFNIIYNELCPYIQRNDTNLKFLISVEERVAIRI